MPSRGSRRSGHVSGIRQMLVPSAICSIDLYVVALTFRTCAICDIDQMPLIKGLGKAERILYSTPVTCSQEFIHTGMPMCVTMSLKVGACDILLHTHQAEADQDGALTRSGLRTLST